MKKGVRPSHPLNIRKHYHIIHDLKIKLTSNVFSSKKATNAVALKHAQKTSIKTGISYKGGCFSQDGLAFYIIGEKHIEVIACEEHGVDHIIHKGVRKNGT